jgi:hypothetical protein
LSSVDNTMSKEMLLGKSNTNRAEGVRSTTVVVEEKKKKRGGGLPLILIAVGLAAVALTSITVLAPASFYGYVESPSSINDSGNGNRGDGAAGAALPTGLASSLTAMDGKGNVIEHKGVTESGTMTITGYSDDKYDGGLQCSINSLPLYCGDNSITVSGLPPGEYTIAIVDPTGGETIGQAFSWEIY